MGDQRDHVSIRKRRYHQFLALFGLRHSELAKEIDMNPKTTFKWGDMSELPEMAPMRKSSMEKIVSLVRERYPNSCYHLEIEPFLRGESNEFMDYTYTDM